MTPASFNPDPLRYTYEQLVAIEASLLKAGAARAQLGAHKSVARTALRVGIADALRRVRDLLDLIRPTLNGVGG